MARTLTAQPVHPALIPLLNSLYEIAGHAAQLGDTGERIARILDARGIPSPSELRAPKPEPNGDDEAQAWRLGEWEHLQPFRDWPIDYERLYASVERALAIAKHPSVSALMDSADAAIPDRWTARVRTDLIGLRDYLSPIALGVDGMGAIRDMSVIAYIKGLHARVAQLDHWRQSIGQVDTDAKARRAMIGQPGDSDTALRMRAVRDSYLANGGKVARVVAELKAEGFERMGQSTVYNYIDRLDDAEPQWRTGVLSKSGGKLENGMTARKPRKR